MFRRENWINTETLVPFYGVSTGRGKAKRFVARGGKPLFFDTAEACDAEVQQMNKRTANVPERGEG